MKNVLLSAVFLFNSLITLAQAGSLDNTFNGDGKVSTPVGNANAIAIQSDGKIVVAGALGSEFLLVRYKSNGSLDHSFGKNGIAKTNFGNSYGAFAVAIQSDGKIVVGGDTYTVPLPGSVDSVDFTLVRYKSNGEPDSTFGTNGVVITDFGNSNDYLGSIALQADSKIVAAGSSGFYPFYDFSIARYKNNGKLDSSFGENGKTITDFDNSADFQLGMAIQADGKIILSGTEESFGQESFALVRYNPNGKPDSTFGVDAKVITTLGTQARSVAIQSDGKIVAGGWTSYDFTIIRYKSNGDLDSSFGKDGIVVTHVGETYGGANSIAIQKDGKIIAAGSVIPSGSFQDNFVLGRYKTNGNLDSSFGTNGLVITDFGSNDVAEAVAIQSDEKIVAAGSSGGNVAVARYLAVGTLPVGVINLNAQFTGKNIIVDWTALNELNIQQYEVQRGANGKDFNTLGPVPALNNRQIKIDYTFTDFSPYAGNNFYRIKTYSKNGTIQYSKTVKVTIADNTSPFVISPNPVKDVLHIQMLSFMSKTISITDSKGRLLQQATMAQNNCSFNVQKLATGIYFLRIDDGQKSTTVKFIKE